jgi:dihydrofolate synthase/folylpolyglutamate synthase
MPPLGELIARLLGAASQAHRSQPRSDARLLARLDHPERKLPPVIHVAGTNGKGSTIAYLRAILEAAGLRVHVYTSPYLVRINERFRSAAPAAACSSTTTTNCARRWNIASAPMRRADHDFRDRDRGGVLPVRAASGRCRAAGSRPRRPARRHQRDRAPLATVITPVSMDHTEFLGDTLTAIAGEKAGIIKRGVPAICAEQPREAMAVIERRQGAHARAAARRRAALARQCRARAAGLSGRSRPDGSAGAKTVRPASVRQCRPRDRDAARDRRVQDRRGAFEAGIVGAEWPARMQRLASGALVDQAPPGCEIWLDGGHNAEGGASPRRRWAISKSGCRARWW